MTADIIHFSAARFTPSDIAEFAAIAGPRIQRGVWGSFTRQTNITRDKLIIHFPNIARPVFSFERDHRGVYTLWFHDKDRDSILARGDTAAKCLWIWMPSEQRQQLKAEAVR